MSLKVFQDDEDDSNKFYLKLSQAQPSNYLEIWLFSKNVKKIILKRIIWLPVSPAAFKKSVGGNIY